MASFEKRGTRWQCRVYRGVLRRTVARSGATKREALARAQARCRELESGVLVDAHKLTLETYLRRWLGQHETNIAPLTSHSYAKRLERYVIPNIGHLPLARLRPMDVQELYARLAKSGRRDGRLGGLHASTIRSTHIPLHKALADAVRMQVLTRNVTDAVLLPKVPKRVVEAPTVADAHAVLAAVAGTRVEAETTFAVYSGVRQGELLALRWSAVDLEAATATVYRSVRRVPRVGLVVRTPKTASGIRTIPLVHEVVAMLRRHRVQQAERRLKLGPAWQDHDLLFPNAVGSPQDPRNVLRRFHRVLARAGLPRMRWHDLRHWTASLMISAGVPLSVVSDVLGHAGIQVTKDFYGHIEFEAKRDAVERLGSVLANRQAAAQ